jgi:hypothetical protein
MKNRPIKILRNYKNPHTLIYLNQDFSSSWILYMKNRPIKILRNCKDSHTLIYLNQDFSLSWHETISLKSHLLLCKSCFNLNKNTTMLSLLLKKWRNHSQII